MLLYIPGNRQLFYSIKILLQQKKQKLLKTSFYNLDLISDSLYAGFYAQDTDEIKVKSKLILIVFKSKCKKRDISDWMPRIKLGLCWKALIHFDIL